MAEPTLSLTGTKIEGAIARFLGFGPGAASGGSAWTATQATIIAECRESGERQFYYPPATPTTPAGYDWTFLHPTTSLTLTSGERTVALPDDFGGFEGDISVTLGSNRFGPVEIIGEASLTQRYSDSPSWTGRPICAAEKQLRGTTLSKGQRSDLFVFPLPDDAYVLAFQYWLLPDATSGTRPYAYGGSAHAETLQASCIAAAELYQDNARGSRWAYFMERLQASIGADRKHAPTLLGYNGDRSDNREYRVDSRSGFAPIKVGGVLYQ